MRRWSLCPLWIGLLVGCVAMSACGDDGGGTTPGVSQPEPEPNASEADAAGDAAVDASEDVSVDATADVSEDVAPDLPEGDATEDVPTPDNAPPTATGAAVELAEDGTLALTLEGVDPEGQALAFEVLTQPAHGVLEGDAPDVTYRPNADFHGPDAFTFRVNDGLANSAPATVALTVTPVNDPPAATGQTLEVVEDDALALVLAGTDAEGDALSYMVTVPPEHGVLEGDAPDMTYRPNADYHGSDSFEFVVNDGQGDSAPATVALTITSVNDAPLALAQRLTLAEDEAGELVLTGSDVDGDALTFAVVTPPTLGVLSGLDAQTGAVVYTPNPDANGQDSFTFTVNDGQSTSAPATVSVTLNAVNDVPVATGQTLEVAEDGSVAVVLSGSDVDQGQTLTFEVLTPPAHGMLEGDAPNVTYRPNADYHGPDAFTFRVNDGLADSAPATVALTVTPVNDPPVAQAQQLTLAEDGVLEVALSGADVEGDALSYTVTVPPEHGVLEGDAPSVTYRPNADYHGTDSFAFVVNDGLADSAPATVALTVTPVNDAPLALEQALEVAEDGALALVLEGTDAEGDALSYTVTAPPAHGVLEGDAPNVTYRPNADYHGPDAVTFRVNDGQGDSAPAAVALTVTPVNDAPVALAQQVSLEEDQAGELVLTGSDVDGDALTFAVVTPPTLGVLSGLDAQTGAVVYTPNPDANGQDSFTFTVNDGQSTSAPTTVSVTLNAVNDAPLALGQTLEVTEDGALGVVLQGSDIDGDALVWRVTRQPAHGVLEGDAPNVTYRPNADYHGQDSFEFVVNDGQVDSAPATVALTVTPVNDAPVAQAQQASFEEDQAGQLVLAGSDVDGDALTFAVVTPPTLGVLSGLDAQTGAVIYTPNPDANGQDSFEFVVNDGQVSSAPATVSVTLNVVNDVPLAQGQQLTLTEDSSMAVVLSGSDVDQGQTLTFEVLTQPAHGALEGDAPNVTYRPNLNFHGQDSFTFRVNDGLADSAPATVALTVTPVNDPPVAVDQTARVGHLSTTDIDVLAGSSDPEGSALRVVEVEGVALNVPGDEAALPSGSRVTLLADGRLRYRPGAQFAGLAARQEAQERFSFTLSDIEGAHGSAQVTVTVQGDYWLEAVNAPERTGRQLPFVFQWQTVGRSAPEHACQVLVGGQVVASSAQGLDCNAGQAQVRIDQVGDAQVTFQIQINEDTLSLTTSTSVVEPITAPAATHPSPIVAGHPSEYSYSFTAQVEADYTCFLDLVDDGQPTYNPLQAVDCADGGFALSHTFSTLDPRVVRAYVVAGDLEHFRDPDPATDDFVLVELGQPLSVEPVRPVYLDMFQVEGDDSDPAVTGLNYTIRFRGNNDWAGVDPRIRGLPLSCAMDVFDAEGNLVYESQGEVTNATYCDFDEIMNDHIGLSDFNVRLTLTSGSYAEVHERTLRKKAFVIGVPTTRHNGDYMAINDFGIGDHIELTGYDGMLIDRIEVGVVWGHTETDWHSIALEKDTVGIPLYGDPGFRCDVDDQLGVTYNAAVFGDGFATPADGYCDPWHKSDLRGGGQGVINTRPSILPMSLLRNEPINGRYSLWFWNPENRGHGVFYGWAMKIWPTTELPTYLDFRPRGHQRLDNNRSWGFHVEGYDGYTIWDMNVNAILNYASANWLAKWRFDSDVIDLEGGLWGGRTHSNLERGILEIFLRHVAPDGDEIFVQIYSNEGLCNDLFDNNLGHECFTDHWFFGEQRSGDCEDSRWVSIGFRSFEDAEYPKDDPRSYCPSARFIMQNSGNPATYYGGPHATVKIQPNDHFDWDRAESFHEHFRGRPVNGYWELQIHRNSTPVDTSDFTGFIPPWTRHAGSEGDGSWWGWDLNMTVTAPGCAWHYAGPGRPLERRCP